MVAGVVSQCGGYVVVAGESEQADHGVRVAKHSGGGRTKGVTDAKTLLFGLPGLRVERVERWADGTRVVYAVTGEQAASACPSCGGVVHVGDGAGGGLAT